MSFFLPLQHHKMMREGELRTVYCIYKLETYFRTLTRVAGVTAGATIGIYSESSPVLLPLDEADYPY
jgi:hypothetical protein